MINNSELLFVVDANNNPLEPKSRKEVHQKSDWHRTTHIWIVNAKNQLLCQKRTILKDTNPGKWEGHFGGHVANGQEYIDNVLIEIQEELGLKREKKDIIFVKVYKDDKDKEFQAIFYTKWNGIIDELHMEKEEVEQVVWVTISDIEKIYKRKDKAWVHHGYEESILQTLKG